MENIYKNGKWNIFVLVDLIGKEDFYYYKKKEEGRRRMISKFDCSRLCKRI